MEPVTWYYYERNPWFSRLLGRGGVWSQLARMAGLFAAWYGMFILVCWIEGCFFIDGPNAGLWEDLLHPGLFIGMFWMAAATFGMLGLMEKLLGELTRMLQKSDRHAQRIADRIRQFVAIRSRRGKKWYLASQLFFLLLVYGFQVHGPLFAPAKGAVWALLPYEYPIAFAMGIALAVFIWVAMMANFFWYAMAGAFTVFLVIFRYAQRDKLVVLPIAVDGKAGLSRIGEFAFSLSLSFAGGMVPVIAYMFVFGLDVPLMIAFGLYFVFLGTVFFLPLITTHLAMVRARDKELERLANAFHRIYRNLPDDNADRRPDPEDNLDADTRDKVEVLCRLEQLYSRAENMPVWPMNFNTLGKFSSLIILPVILIVVDQVLSRLFPDRF